MSLKTIARAANLPITVTNPLTATTGVSFNSTVTMPDPPRLLNGAPTEFISLQTLPFTVRCDGTWFCNSGTTPNLTCQIYLGGIVGTQVATTGAVAVGNTQPSSGSWFIDGRYIWDSVSGLNGMYWGFVGGTNSVQSSPARAMNYVTGVSAPTWPTSVTFTATALFSATGATNTATLTSFVIEFV